MFENILVRINDVVLQLPVQWLLLILISLAVAIIAVLIVNLCQQEEHKNEIESQIWRSKKYTVQAIVEQIENGRVNLLNEDDFAEIQKIANLESTVQQAKRVLEQLRNLPDLDNLPDFDYLPDEDQIALLQKLGALEVEHCDKMVAIFSKLESLGDIDELTETLSSLEEIDFDVIERLLSMGEKVTVK